MNSFHKVRGVLYFLSRGYFAVLLQEARKELRSAETSYAFRRDLSVPFATRPASLAIHIMPFEKGDTVLFALDGVPHDMPKAQMDRVREWN